MRLAEDLGRRVALALDNAHLYEVAQEAIQTREQVIGVVAHDLRNPVNTILMAAELLARPGADPERRKEHTERLARAVRRMTRLIDDLMDVQRLDSGPLPIERELLPARDIIIEAVESERPLAAKAGVVIAVELPQDLPDILGDRHRLLQVFDNLVGNAIKFTPRGGQIVVRAVSRGDAVQFSIADNGVGVSEENMPHLFDRFWQAKTTDRRGAGLGLPIAKGIVEAHGGYIWVDSKLGVGTTVCFTIPVARPRALRPGAAPAA
jgi:signal transduction histidine kinase